MDQENAISKMVEGFKIEGDLKREVGLERQAPEGHQGLSRIAPRRHMPTRGQRTKTNSRTVRGNVRKTMGSGKRKEEKK